MKILQAGPLTLGYENGFLRRITYRESEVLRMIYFALRDHNWNTVPGSVANEVINARQDHFEISYDYLQHYDGRVVMTWQAVIKGNPDGSIVFQIGGKMNEDFRKNRAGFCILHPLSAADQLCTIGHPDKSQSAIFFPRTVSPDNPFRNIESMSWDSGETPFVLEFEGDVFEMEDQRNWGDASFKTFCTPLDLPFPVAMKKGQEVFQRVTLRPRTPLQAAVDRPDGVALSRSRTTNKVPLLGIGASTELPAVPESVRALLQPLRLHHYRIDIYPGHDDWVTHFSTAYEAGYSLNVPLEVALHLTENFEEELEAFVVVCQQNKVKLRKVLLLQVNAMVTGQEIIDRISGLKAQLPTVSFGAGTDYNFNEINRNRFRGDDADYISFSMDPQEHAFDDLTVLENAATPAYQLESARAIYGAEKDVHLSPITLRRRFNPYATNPEDLFLDEAQKVDPRQQHAFAAVWTFACLCSMTKGNATACTLFQTAGRQGIISAAGEPYPVYAVVKAFAPYQRRSVNVLESSDPLAVQGVLLDEKVLGLANLRSKATIVRWNDRDFNLQPLETTFTTLDGAQ